MTILAGLVRLEEGRVMLCERRVASSGQEVVTSLNTAIDRREEVGKFLLELQMKVHAKVRNHGKCSYLGLLLVKIKTLLRHYANWMLALVGPSP